MTDVTGTGAPLAAYRTRVTPEWVDYNGHMSEAYYVLVFGFATDAFYDAVGLDDAFRRATATSVYTVEAHINYLAEAHEGDELCIETRLLGHDAKRLILYHAMYRDFPPTLLAATEIMALHVDKRILKSAPFPVEAAGRIDAIAAAQAGFDPPRYAGRRIALP